MRNDKLYRNESLAQLIEMYICSLRGIRTSTVNAVLGTVIIVYDPRTVDIEALVKKVTVLIETRPATLNFLEEHRQEFFQARQQLHNARQKMYIFGGLYVIFKAKKYFFGKFLFSESLPALEIAAAVTIIGGYPVFKKYYCKVAKYLPIDSDQLLILIGTSLTFVREGGRGILLMFLQAVNDTLRASATLESQKLVLGTHPNPFTMVWCERDGEEILLPVQTLQEGDQVTFSADDLILLEGTIHEGRALVNYTNYNGQPEFHLLEKRARVSQGMEIVDGQIKVNVEHVPEMDMKPAIDLEDLLLHERVVTYQENSAYLAMGIAFAGYLLTGNALTSVAVLLAMNPRVTSLVLNGGITNYLKQMRKQGIILRNLNSIEKIHRTRSIIFDKTGTLTSNVLQVVHVESLTPGYTREEILHICARAEATVCHPVAATFREMNVKNDKKGLAGDPRKQCQVCTQTELVKDNEMSNIHYVPSRGVISNFAGQKVVIGNRQFMREEDIDLRGVNSSKDDKLRMARCMPIFVAIGGLLVGKIYLREQLLPESLAVVNYLQEMGYTDVTIVSGDLLKNTRAIARQLNIQEYYGRMDIDRKGQFVKEKGRNTTVMMIGDGINDTAAMRSADVSVAIGNACGQVIWQADCLLAERGLENLPHLLRLTNENYRRIDKDISLAMIGNLALGLVSLVLGWDLFQAETFSVSHALFAFTNSLQPTLL